MKNEHDLEYEKNICYKEGLEEGRSLIHIGRSGRIERCSARKLLSECIAPETVARCVGIALEEVKALRENLYR